MKNYANGPEYWRSLEQLADSPEMREMISKEFPGYDADTIATTSRRSFLKFMGASLAMAGFTLNGCRRIAQERLAPYTANPRDRIPGVPEFYATAWELGGVATGLLVTNYDGRPIKIEGNPSHPFSVTVKDKIGSADGFAQASVLDLYDPHRSQLVLKRTNGEVVPSSWPVFAESVRKQLESSKEGTGFAILSEATESPSVADMRKRLLTAMPQAKWYEYEPLTRDNDLEGSRLVYGKAVRTRLHLENAAVVISLDADLLGTHPAHVRYAADWVTRRRSADHGEMSRVYVIESGFTITGSIADERLGVDPSRISVIARAIAMKAGVAGVTNDVALTATEAKFVDHAAADLKEAGAAGVISAGPSASPAVAALVHAINHQIGAIGKTVTLLEDPASDRPSHMQAISNLVAEINSGKVSTLLMLGGNASFDVPADLEFGKALAKVPTSIHLGHYEDETSAGCTWHLPRAHYLETWGDARAWDGTVSILQPLIEPLFGGKSIVETLALITGDSVTSGEGIVRRTLQGIIKGDDFDKQYRRALERGVLPDTAYAVMTPEMKPLALPPDPASPHGFFVRFDSDTHLYDGRFANNGWLQETPDTMTKLTWDNALNISKKDADAQGIKTGDMVKLEVGGRSIDIAAYILPGQPVGVLGVALGYGRRVAGPVGKDLGFNTYPLRTAAAPYAAPGATLKRTGKTYDLAMTQEHHIIDAVGAAGRDIRTGPKNGNGEIIHEAIFSEYKADKNAAREHSHTIPLQLFEPPMTFNTPHAWGMSIDLNACIGCNACAVACQAENNIPIVGKEQVLVHREMNWIRIDRYFRGAADDPDVEVIFQPVTCQHCENAPCEQVCPVAATVHDSEGLNTMVYNRCIGTRYCSNNCPYKVRRFNYLDYNSKDPRQKIPMPWPGMPDTQQNEMVDRVKRMVFNPEVTVRMRGVMEKCTYCVQRIHNVSTAKRAAGQEVVDGDIITACQQSCPTQAIIFGNLNESEAEVTKLHKNPRSYKMLDEELNTRPRTVYLAKVRNPVEAGSAGA